MESSTSATTSTTLPTYTESDTIPSSVAQWYDACKQDYCEPIDSPEDADRDHVVNVAKHHAEQMVEITGMDVDLSNITGWNVTYELKSRHGYHRRMGSNESQIKLSMNSLETNGWPKFLQTVRHEVVHAWQYQHDRWDDGDTKWERAHGDEFEQWMDTLAIKKCGSSVVGSARYRVECPSCHRSWERHKECKTTKFARAGSSSCPECKESVWLFENGIRQFTQAMPDHKCDLTMLKGIDEDFARKLSKKYEVDSIHEVRASLSGDHEFFDDTGAAKNWRTDPYYIAEDLDDTEVNAVCLQLGLNRWVDGYERKHTVTLH